MAPPRPPASSIASSAPAPPSVVAEPPTRDEDHLRAARDRVGDQLAGAVRARRPGVALVLGDEREAGGRRHLDQRRAAVLDERRSRPRSRARAGRCTRGGDGLAAEVDEQRVERAVAAVGQRAAGRAASGPARSSPRPIAPATWAARNVPLNESGATRTGRSGTATAASCHASPRADRVRGLRGRRARDQALEPRQGLLPAVGLDEGRSRPLPRGVRRRDPQPRARAPDDAQALPGRDRGEGDLPEARAREAARSGCRRRC